jgi:hypothetical protein
MLKNVGFVLMVDEIPPRECHVPSDHIRPERMAGDSRPREIGIEDAVVHIRRPAGEADDWLTVQTKGTPTDERGSNRPAH